MTVGAVDVAPDAPLKMNLAARIHCDPADLRVTGLRLLEYNHELKELPLLIEGAGFSVQVALKSEADKESKSEVNGVIAAFALDHGSMTSRGLFTDMCNMRIQPPAGTGAAHPQTRRSKGLRGSVCRGVARQSRSQYPKCRTGTAGRGVGVQI